MTFKELLDAVLARNVAAAREEWHVIVTDLWSATPVTTATYKGNVAISLVWGRKHKTTFTESWTEVFPDPAARSVYVDLCYHGAPVARIVAVGVNGGRCWLPMPTRSEKSQDLLTVSGAATHLIRLMDAIEHTDSQFDWHFKEAGLHEVMWSDQLDSA
jgi:hypothetical protein